MDGQCGGSRNGFSIVDHDLCSLVGFEKLTSEWPARANDEVASHVQALGLIEANLQHVDPFRAEPLQRAFSDAIGVGRKGHGVDFHASDARFFQQSHLSDEFVGFYFVAVPPPTHERSVVWSGLLKSLVELLRRRTIMPRLTLTKNQCKANNQDGCF